jgi:hypothetical protein
MKDTRLTLTMGILVVSSLGAVLAQTERIAITRPAFDARVSSPVTVSGKGSATQHNELGIRIRDVDGKVIGEGTAHVKGQLGRRGPYTAKVKYVLKGKAHPGRIEVFDTSPRDGELVHLATVEVRLTPTSP